MHPQISRDGTLLAYSLSRQRIRIAGIEQLPPRVMVGTGKGVKVWDLSADNKRLLIARFPDPNIYMHDVSLGRDSLFFSKPGYALFQGRFSPDGRALALIACDSQ